MNVYDYCVIETFKAEFGVATYGISVLQRQEGQWHVICSVGDISSNKDFVVQLAERCQRLQLDYLHFIDVILDAIS